MGARRGLMPDTKEVTTPEETAVERWEQETLEPVLRKRPERRQRFETVSLDTCIGRVTELETLPVRPDLAAYDCRNNRLAQRGLELDGFAVAVAAAGKRHGGAENQACTQDVADHPDGPSCD